jgi:hypothetical protein
MFFQCGIINILVNNLFQNSRYKCSQIAARNSCLGAFLSSHHRLSLPILVESWTEMKQKRNMRIEVLKIFRMFKASLQ